MGNKYGCKSNKLWVGKKIVQEGITHAPDLYKYGTSKIKNKKYSTHLILILQIMMLQKHRIKQKII